MTILPPPVESRDPPEADPVGTALLDKLRGMAKDESGGDYIVQVRVTPKVKSPHNGCQCCCG